MVASILFRAGPLAASLTTGSGVFRTVGPQVLPRRSGGLAARCRPMQPEQTPLSTPATAKPLAARKKAKAAAQVATPTPVAAPEPVREPRNSPLCRMACLQAPPGPRRLWTERSAFHGSSECGRFRRPGAAGGEGQAGGGRLPDHLNQQRHAENRKPPCRRGCPFH